MTASPEAARWLELSVLELLTCWPASAQLFLHRRMACVGCDFSRFDRVSEALEIHGLSPGEFLEDLVAVIGSQSHPATDLDPGAS
jgi:hybrid cluster-associated redox disulfide protein